MGARSRVTYARLSGSGLAVGEYGTVVALDDFRENGGYDVVVNEILGGIGCEYPIERKGFGQVSVGKGRVQGQLARAHGGERHDGGRGLAQLALAARAASNDDLDVCFYGGRRGCERRDGRGRQDIAR